MSGTLELQCRKRRAHSSAHCSVSSKKTSSGNLETMARCVAKMFLMTSLLWLVPIKRSSTSSACRYDNHRDYRAPQRLLGLHLNQNSKKRAFVHD